MTILARHLKPLIHPISWVFFSGVNVVYEDDTGLEVFDDLYSIIMSNCRVAPDSSFVAAIINSYAELKK